MPRKITLKKMSERLDKIEKKRAKRQNEIEAIDKEYKELSKAVAAEKERVRIKIIIVDIDRQINYDCSSVNQRRFFDKFK